MLFIGDVCGRCGRDALFRYLPDLKYDYNIDFTIANGENSAGGLGITRKTYDEMSRAGVDFFTLGNHAFSKADVSALLSDGENIVRPENMLLKAPVGNGMEIVRTESGEKIAIINIIGRVYMQEAADPFEAAERLCAEAKNATDNIIVDFHAEATSEKEAMGYFLDGKASAVIGTHTHVQTADERILEKGTAYITDVGMTGALNSVLGMETGAALDRFLSPEKRTRFRPAEGDAVLCALMVDISGGGRAREVERIWKS